MATFVGIWLALFHLIDLGVHCRQSILQKSHISIFPNDWRVSDWITVDDRIRGGSSHSFLKVKDGDLQFYGNLDTTTLGGAGFASQQFWFLSPQDASKYSGIYIRVVDSDEKQYSLNLVNKYPTKREDGRNESQIIK